jgi:hypothetical protein
VRKRRPDDRILTIIYNSTSSTPLKFDEENRGAGDVVIVGIAQPEDPAPTKPAPTTAPSVPTSNHTL